MSALTIVLPRLGETPHFERTFQSILKHRPRGCQFIVVQEPSVAVSPGVDGSVEFLACDFGAQWHHFLDAALPFARGEIIHVLQPGVEVREGWLDYVIDEFEDKVVGAVAPLIVDVKDDERIMTADHERLRMYEGDLFVGVMGNRYATDAFEAEGFTTVIAASVPPVAPAGPVSRSLPVLPGKVWSVVAVLFIFP